MKVTAAILITDGINCNEELAYAFESAGARAAMVHVNDLLGSGTSLSSYQILALPGGFSYGDDLFSGKILANELLHRLKHQLAGFLSRDTLILGICNGFQVLVRMGLLPWESADTLEVSLITNDPDSFQCRWVRLKIAESPCVFTRNLTGKTIELPVAHGEGRLVVRDKRIEYRLINRKHAVVYYADKSGKRTMRFPDNPNGSLRAIAGLTDATGRIFGMMPHPERNIWHFHHPNWQSEGFRHASCLPIFQNAVEYFR